MTHGKKISFAVVAAALAALIVPAFASMGHIGRAMMAGCAEMMQSMNNGDNSTPNSQWQNHPPRNPENGN